MTYSIKRANIIVVICVFIVTLCLSVLLFEKNVYGDEEITYNVAGGLPNAQCEDTITFWFNVDSLPKSPTTVRLAIEGELEPAGSEVYFIETGGTQHYLGLLKPPDFSRQWIYLNLNPSWVKVGENTVRVVIDIGACGTVYDANLIIEYERERDKEAEKPVWVRTMPMTCWQVWINEDNNFQFIFWYPYKDNNWVRIYDMEDNMVHETDLPINDPNLIVDLPDGMYTVRTFHHDTLLQEFIIGKP